MHTTTISRPRRLFGVGIVSVSLLLASCGGDDDAEPAQTTAPAPATESATESATEPDPEPTSTEAPTPTEPTSTKAPASTEPPTTDPAGPTGSPVIVAALTDQSGPSSGTQKDAPDILNAWADFINANGGVNGHPVVIEVRDTKGDPATAQSALDELVAMNPGLLYIADSTSESSLAAGIEASGIPLVGVGYNPAVWGGNIEAFKLACSPDEGAPVACALTNAFTITTTFGAVVDEQVIAAQLAGATKLATAACAEVDSCSAAAPVFDATAAALGIENAGVTKVSSTAPDYTAECIKWVQDGIDFIQISASGEMGARLYSDCTDQGYDGLFGASAGTVGGALIKVDGIHLVGGLNAFPWWVDDAPVAEFRDAMNAAGVAEDAWSNPNATGTWSVMQLWAKGMSNTDITADDEITKEASLAAMYTISDETLDGLISPVTFTEGERASHRPCFWPYELKDGVFTALNGGLKYSCNPPEA